MYSLNNNILIQYNIGSKRHFAEFGIGIGSTYIKGSVRYSATGFGGGGNREYHFNHLYVYPIGVINYRYQANSGFLLKISAATYYNSGGNHFLLLNYRLLPAISLGWRF